MAEAGSRTIGRSVTGFGFYRVLGVSLQIVLI